MANECDWHHEGDETAPVIGNRLRQLTLRRRVEPILEVARHVLQRVGVPPRGRQLRQRVHESVKVTPLHLPP
jgi:hypothetical protein